MSLRCFGLLCLLLLGWGRCHAVCVNCPSAKVRFVNNTNPSTGTGTYADPYNNLHYALEPAHSSPCDVIYVFPSPMSYDTFNTISMSTQAFVLQDNQRLLSTTVEAFQRCPFECDLPFLTNNTGSPGVVVLLANNNEVSGFRIDTGSGNTSGIGGLIFTNAKITNNVITTYNGGNCVFFFNSPNLGNVTVSNCFLFGGDSTATMGITLGNNGNARVDIFENTIGGVSPGRGVLQGMIVFQSTGDHRVHIHDNNVILQNARNVPGDVSVGIAIYTQMPSSGNFTAQFDNNRVNSVAARVQALGIGGINDIGSGNLCLVVDNNNSITSSGVPGYFFTNFSTNSFRLDFDNSNEGTLLINELTQNITIPVPPSGFSRVFLNSGCP